MYYLLVLFVQNKVILLSLFDYVFLKIMRKIIALLVMVITSVSLFTSCEMVELSPNLIFDSDSPTKINATNIERLLATPNWDDTLRIIFTGDSQSFYEDSDRLVKQVNSMNNIDFLIHSGDISDFGLLQEFKWIDEVFSRLTVPYISVVGNHDMQANGREVYKKMYGDLNFSFVYNGIKFIFHDTNSREYKFNGKVPDLDFLKRELQPSPNHTGIVAISHVPPFDDDFDKTLEYQYNDQFKNCEEFLVSLHGHWHTTNDLMPYGDGVRYINSNSTSKSQMLLLEIVNNTLTKTLIDY
jgi:Icc protein